VQKQGLTKDESAQNLETKQEFYQQVLVCNVLENINSTG